MSRSFPLIISLISLILGFTSGCGDDDDDSDGGDDHSADDDTDSTADDDDDVSDDDDDADDDTQTDDDTADDDSADDDTEASDCEEAVTHALACNWVIPGVDAPMTGDEAIADCAAPSLQDADTWACMFDCIAGLDADCGNAQLNAACIPICVFHKGHVPDPDTCTPMFPNFKACGHRGENSFAPANTIPSFEAAIEHGAALIEVDVRVTSDGYLVCSHDEDVSAFTDGTGIIEEMTLAEIKVLAVNDAMWDGQFPDLRIPTFEEAMDAINGRAMIDIDDKSAPKEMVIQAVDDAGMRDDVIAYCSGTGEADEYMAIDPTFPIMPAVYSLDEAVYALATYEPDYIELESLDIDVIEAVHAAGATTFLDALGIQDLMAVLGFFEPWFDMLDQGIDIIQTDQTVMLVPFVETLCAEN